MAISQERRTQINAMRRKSPQSGVSQDVQRGISPERRAEIDALLSQMRAQDQTQGVPKYIPPADLTIDEGGAEGIVGGAVGFGKKILSKGFDIAQSGAKIGEFLADSPVGRAFGDIATSGMDDQEKQALNARLQKLAQIQASTMKTPEALIPQGKAERTGAQVEQIAEFFVPGVGATKYAGTAAKLLPKLGRAAPIVGRGIEEAVTGAAIGLGQTGDVAGAARGAGIDLGITTGLGALGAAGKAVSPFFKGVQRAQQAVPSQGVQSVAARGAGSVGTSQGLLPKVVPAVREAGAQVFGFGQRGLSASKQKVEELAKISNKPLLQKQLYRSGLSEDFIDRVVKADKPTKSLLNRMVQRIEANKDPIKVVGDQLTTTASRLAQKLKSSGQRLGAVKRGLRGQLIDMSEVQNAIVKDLDDLRLSVKGKQIVPQKGVPADEDTVEVLNDIYQFVGSASDAEIADLLRNYLRKGYSKKGAPFNTNAQRLMTKYRELLLNEISSVDTVYGQLAREYAEIITALQDFAKIINYTGDIEKINRVALGAGRVSRRILGRGSARPEEVITKLVETANKYGIKSDSDLMGLLRFADSLDDEIGLTQTTGAQATAQRAVEGALDRFGGSSLPIEAGKGLLRLGRPGTKDRLKALKSYLSGLSLGIQKKSETFERAKGLNPADRIVEDRAFRDIETSEAALLKKNQENHGKVVNTDDFRQLFQGYTGNNAAAVQEPSSYLSKKAFAEGLKRKGKFAIFYAGGSGSGKTSAINSVPRLGEILRDSSVVLDSNFSSYDSAIKKIKQALDAGKKTPIIYVFRNPVESFEDGVVKRMLTNEKEMGRLVPSKVVADNHIESWNVVQRLAEEGFDVIFIDNSLGRGKVKETTLDALRSKIKYPSKQALGEIFNKIAKRLLDEGKISPEQYQGYIN